MNQIKSATMAARALSHEEREGEPDDLILTLEERVLAIRIFLNLYDEVLNAVSLIKKWANNEVTDKTIAHEVTDCLNKIRNSGMKIMEIVSGATKKENQ